MESFQINIDYNCMFYLIFIVCYVNIYLMYTGTKRGSMALIMPYFNMHFPISTCHFFQYVHKYFTF
jgi:hypothetical protein